MSRIAWRFLTVLCVVVGCATSGGETSSGGGAAGAATSGKGPTSSVTGAGGGGLSCDDLGFCGEVNDPGCQACAYTQGSCVAELEACKAAQNDECISLNHCYVDCAEDDGFCQKGCEETYPLGVDLLSRLATCILCVECPISCATDLNDCPG